MDVLTILVLTLHDVVCSLFQYISRNVCHEVHEARDEILEMSVFLDEEYEFVYRIFVGEFVAVVYQDAQLVVLGLESHKQLLVGMKHPDPRWAWMFRTWMTGSALVVPAMIRTVGHAVGGRPQLLTLELGSALVGEVEVGDDAARGQVADGEEFHVCPLLG